MGGTGNDVYLVDSATDAVVEVANEGDDEIRTALAAYTLSVAARVERLTYAGTAAFAGTGNGLANTITGSTNDDMLLGGALSDTLYGGSGNDLLDGGTEVDSLYGGAGDDIYIVDSQTDAVIESAASGMDEVRTSVALYALTQNSNVEKLTYTGAAAFTGNGNELANTITGGAGADSLSGGLGLDTLMGGAGNDALFGGDNSDVLDGGTGDDTLTGGMGADILIVDSLGDIVVAPSYDGDIIKTTLGTYDLSRMQTYAAAANDLRNSIRFLEYAGTAAFLGTGNELSNDIKGGGDADTLIGNGGSDALNGNGGNDSLNGGAGADNLNGGTGADTLNGGAGNDTYTVDDVGDLVAGEGSQTDLSDQVFSSLAAYTLTDGVEILTLNEGLASAGIGNALNNFLQGNASNNSLVGYAGNDSLYGGSGNDTLTGGSENDSLDGGAGNDILYGGLGLDFMTGGINGDAFVFNTALNATTNVDTITDMVHGVDRIHLENLIFTALGANGTTLTAAEFWIGAAAHDADDNIIYNSSTGALTYDSNGNAAGGATRIATLSTGLALTNADFWII